MLRCVANIPRPARTIVKPSLQISSTILTRNIKTHDLPPSKHSDKPQPSTQDAPTPAQSEPPPPMARSMESLLADTKPADNPLLARVHTREDAEAVLNFDHPAANILTQPGLVVQRHYGTMGIVSRLEQVDKYVILDPRGNHIGYMAEHDGMFQKILPGQWFRTHRAFTTHVFDRHVQEVLRFHRPFSWTSTQTRVYDALERKSRLYRTNDNNPELGLSIEAMPIIGEARSRGPLQSRKYDLLLAKLGEPMPGSISAKPAEDSSELRNQKASQIVIIPIFAHFAHINKPFSSLDFQVTAEDGRLIGLVNRSFRATTQEDFASTGAYVFRLDSARLEQETQREDPSSRTGNVDQTKVKVLGEEDNNHGLTLDQRAVMLGTAATLNLDYFAGQSTDAGLPFIPIPVPGGGKSAGAGAGAGNGGGGEVGGVVGGVGRTAGGAAAGTGFSDSTIAGAGTLAGYEAMQRGMGQTRSPATQDASSQVPQPDSQSSQSAWESQDQKGDAWGQGDSDPWSDPGAPSGGGDGGGWFQRFWDLFT
ncbi:uncharacterized protein A1O9_01646 [Exophiala aquamarina CBS 119918]|uniref:Scramblase n=1 Tax=Exophiala aquamarina CBS 119918 TaxID=1182545 RepID=A0A072PWC1_9EURO|nr:uncharacterized protein A1O9_01646 [Exophiala aquamarina CBS 119918]KEF63668.1 hypothetical protein A1O9_01646 [Exophiala aquamarina CBS 119918]